MIGQWGGGIAEQEGDGPNSPWQYRGAIQSDRVKRSFQMHHQIFEALKKRTNGQLEGVLSSEETRGEKLSGNEILSGADVWLVVETRGAFVRPSESYLSFRDTKAHACTKEGNLAFMHPGEVSYFWDFEPLNSAVCSRSRNCAGGDSIERWKRIWFTSRQRIRGPYHFILELEL